MKLILLMGIMLWIAVSLEAKREREGSEDKGGQRKERKESQVVGNCGRRRKQPFPLFPSCKDFNVDYAKKMEELKKENKVGLGACKGDDRKKCFLNDRDTVRCELGDELPKECLQEINDFLKGVTCSTTGFQIIIIIP